MKRTSVSDVDDVAPAERVAEGVRLQSLDILRGFAILLVLLFHIPQDCELPWIQRPFARGGWSGVDLFFVLSGFLIGSILMREQLRTGRINKQIFWLRRIFKIFPSYFGLLIFYVAVYIRYAYLDILSPTAYLERFYPYWIFVQNYVPVEGLPLAHLWSIAVEEHFYILLPLLIWCLKGNPRPMLLSYIALFFGVATARYLNYYAGVGFHTDWWPWGYTHLRLDSLLGGVIVACLWVHYPKEFLAAIHRRKHILVAFTSFLMMPFIFDPEGPFMTTFGFSFLIVGNSSLLVLSQVLQPGSIRVMSSLGQVIAFVGRTSYNTYLWHIPLFYTGPYRDLVLRASRFAPDMAQPSMFVLIHISAAVATGWLATSLIERPFLRMRARFCPRAHLK